MVKSRRKSSLCRRPFLVILIIFLIALAGLGVSKLIFHFSNQDKDDTVEITPTVEEQDAEESIDVPIKEDDNNDGKPEIIQNEGENPNKLENLTGSITTARVFGEKVIIRVNLDQYLSSGTCSLIMTSGTKTYSTTTNIVESASTSTCEGFDIPISELSSGTWSIAIGISSNGKTGNISGEVSL